MIIGLLILLASSLAVLFGLGSLALFYRLTHPPRLTAGRAAAEGLPLDPEDAGWPYEVISGVDGDGRPLELWAVQGRLSEGPVLVMLHGWADSRIGELAWLETLGPLFSSLLLFDLRGHGESPRSRCTWGDQERKDVREIVALARQRFPNRPVVLFGYSMGAVLALAVAGEEDVAAVLAESPYLSPDDVVQRTMRLSRLPSWPFVPLAFLGLKARWPLLRQQSADMARRVHAPTLVLHGQADRVVPVRDVQHLAEELNRGELRLFSDADHLEAVRQNPVEYQRTIREFLHTRNVLRINSP